ncbi:MAG TPA: hypothetical protein VHX86_15585 [Tepidisphaeraceae bacterium]|nr:hypothetical protein [Tepidisphaeraceae bacterium]
MNVPINYRFSIHGPAVAVGNSCPALDERIQFFLRAFASTAQPKTLPARGEIRPFDLAEVTRSLAPATASERQSDDLVDIYSLAERSWVLDDRWGMCEINLLKQRWQSWVLPRPALDSVRLAEAAVLWPMAQLLRLRGIELIPAISVERAGWGALILCPYSITGEISRLLRAGYRVIGQRWTALVPQHGRIVLRHVPGVVESLDARNKLIGRETAWIDLTAQNPWSAAQLSSCDAVLVIASGRRGTSCGRVVAPSESQALLRRHWPLAELPLNRSRVQPTIAALAAQSLCLSLQLSGHTDEFLQLIEFARHRSASKIQVSIRGALRRHFVPAARAG